MQELSYHVYKILMLLHDYYNWLRTFEEKVLSYHFKAVYENLDAVAAYSTFLHQKEIYEVFPDG